jgi:hypothetical protein
MSDNDESSIQSVMSSIWNKVIIRKGGRRCRKEVVGSDYRELLGIYGSFLKKV